MKRYLIIASFLAIIIGGCHSRAEREIISSTRSILESIKNYKYGDDRSWLPQFQDLIRSAHSKPNAQRHVETLIGRFLKSGASPDAIQMVCLEFRSIASPLSVPILTKLLLEENTAHAALTVLAAIDDPKTDDALRDALAKVPAAVRPELIQVIALRRDQGAIGFLAEFIADNSLSMTAIDAIGTIGGDEAVKILSNAYEMGGVYRRIPIASALLRAADRAESPELRRQTYSMVFKEGQQITLRYHALRELLNLEPSEYVPVLFEEIHSTRPDNARVFIPMMRNLPQTTSLDPLIDRWNTLPENTRGPLMLAIAERGNTRIRPIVLQSLNNRDPLIRQFALRAICHVSLPDDAGMLAGLAASAWGDEQSLAREALYLLEGTSGDEAIMKALEKSTGAQRNELILACADRNIEAAESLLLRDLNSSNTSTRLACIRALGNVGGPTALNALLEQAYRSVSGAEGAQLTSAITSIAARMPDIPGRNEYLLSKMEDNANTNLAKILLPVLGELGDTVFMPRIRHFLASDNPALRAASLTALSVWPDAGPMDDLKSRVERESMPSLRLQAMEAYLRSISISDLRGSERADAFGKAYTMGRSPEERRPAALNLGRLETPSAMQIALGLIAEDPANPDLQNALIRIAGSLRESRPEEVRNEMNRLLTLTTDSTFSDRIRVLLRSLD